MTAARTTLRAYGALSYLAWAIRGEWSGRINILVEREKVGEVMLCEGMIAWACCKHQTEDLGHFLWRLGRITQEHLVAVREEFARHAGKKRFGFILEEEGLMQRPVLRRCLLLHTKNAMARLLSEPAALALPSEAAQFTDEEILFYPEEVLPMELTTSMVQEAFCQQMDEQRWRTFNEDNEVLRPLAGLDGYLASAIISTDGWVLAAHVDSTLFEPRVAAVFLSSMLDASENVAESINLGGVDSTIVVCAEGCLVTRWLDDERQYFAAVLADESCKVGKIKLHLDRAKSGFHDWIAELAALSAAGATGAPVVVESATDGG